MLKLFFKLIGSCFLGAVISLLFFELLFGGLPIQRTASRLIIEGLLGCIVGFLFGMFVILGGKMFQ